MNIWFLNVKNVIISEQQRFENQWFKLSNIFYILFYNMVYNLTMDLLVCTFFY